MDVDTSFLNRAIEILGTLREKSSSKGHPMLASLLEIARQEAEDDLRTREVSRRTWSSFAADDTRLRAPTPA